MSADKVNKRVLLRVSLPEGKSGQEVRLDVLEGVLKMLREMRECGGSRHIEHSEYYGGVSFDLVSTTPLNEDEA